MSLNYSHNPSECLEDTLDMAYHAAMGRIKLAASWGQTSIDSLVDELKDYCNPKIACVIKQHETLQFIQDKLYEDCPSMTVVAKKSVLQGRKITDLSLSWKKSWKKNRNTPLGEGSANSVHNKHTPPKPRDIKAFFRSDEVQYVRNGVGVFLKRYYWIVLLITGAIVGSIN